MESAIQSGVPEAVGDLLKGWSDAECIEHLTATYGGRITFCMPREDANGLNEGTPPILHAARSGNMAIFSTILNAMEEKLTPAEVGLLHRIGLSNK